MNRSVLFSTILAILLLVPGQLFAAGEVVRVDISGKTYSFSGEPVNAMVLANGSYTFSNGTSGFYSLTDVPLNAQGKVVIHVFCNGLAPLRLAYEPIGDTIFWDAYLQKKELPSMVLEDVSCLYVTQSTARVTGFISFDGSPVSAMVLANGEYTFTSNNEPVGSFDLIVPLNSNDEVVLQAFCSGKATHRQILTPSNTKPEGFPWAGSYTLQSFHVLFDTGQELTSENADSFSGTMTIGLDGYCVQDIEVNGEPIIVSGTFIIMDEETVLITSETTSYTAEYTYNGTILTTTVSSGAVGPFTETDVWEKAAVKGVTAADTPAREAVAGAIGAGEFLIAPY